MKHFKSVIEPLIQEIYQTQDLSEGKVKMKKMIESTKVNEESKKKMLRDVDGCQTIEKLWFYATNSMFRFEGLSVNSYNTGSKK